MSEHPVSSAGKSQVKAKIVASVKVKIKNLLMVFDRFKNPSSGAVFLLNVMGTIPKNSANGVVISWIPVSDIMYETLIDS